MRACYPTQPHPIGLELSHVPPRPVHWPSGHLSTYLLTVYVGVIGLRSSQRLPTSAEVKIRIDKRIDKESESLKSYQFPSLLMRLNYLGPAGWVCPCLLVGWFNDQQVYLETGFPQDLVEGWDMARESYISGQIQDLSFETRLFFIFSMISQGMKSGILRGTETSDYFSAAWLNLRTSGPRWR